MIFEEWKPVTQYPELPGYEVSSIGRVRSNKGPGGSLRLLRGIFDTYGYREVRLSAGRAIYRSVCVHRLVAGAFLGPRPEGMEVRHLDGDRLNNTVENLRYGSRSENNKDQVLHGVHFHGSKTACKWGHDFTPENTRITWRGYRTCLACLAYREAKRREQRAALRSAA